MRRDTGEELDTVEWRRARSRHSRFFNGVRRLLCGLFLLIPCIAWPVTRVTKSIDFALLQHFRTVPRFSSWRKIWMHFSFFTQNFVADLRRNDVQKLRQYVAGYEKNIHKRLVRLRLENHPVMITAEGAELAEPRVIHTLEFSSVPELQP